MNDLSTAHIVDSLSQPTDPTVNVGRRRFLQAIGAGVAITAMPTWLASEAAAATPLRAADGVLVLLTMGGGNDGLNTFIPVRNGTYYDRRGSLAIKGADAIRLSRDRSLHPALPFMKKLWDRGDLAVIDGVGQSSAGLSHFVSMGQVMAANGTKTVGNTGWLGRFHDASGSSNPFHSVSIAPSVPLVQAGRDRRAIAVAERRNKIFQTAGLDPTYARQYAALKAMGNEHSGLGYLGDRLADTGARAVDLATQLQPLVQDDQDEPEVVTKLRLAARLINANLGVRIISIIYGDFDTHANQLVMHQARMSELNSGLETFYAELDTAYTDRSLIVGTSEFGRRVAANGSGTDHGAANSFFAVGSQVNKGFYGDLPSLRALDRYGNLRPTIDYRHLYANIVTTWLGGDAAEIVGRNYGDLGLLRAPATKPSRRGKPSATPSGLMAQRASITRLYLAYFDRAPDDAGLRHWSEALQSGSTLANVSTALAGSAEFEKLYGSVDNKRFVELVYANVLGRKPDAAGARHWREALASGAGRGKVMTQFSESAENKKRTADIVWRTELTGEIGRLYRAYFGRAADRAGLEFWTNTGSPAKTVSEAFATSAEFTSRYGSLGHAEFVDLVYKNVLGRAADKAGRQHWIKQLVGGRSRGAVMLAFSNSAEFKAKVKRLT